MTIGGSSATQLSNEITRRIKPREYDSIVQQNCRTAESAARTALTLDFESAQRLQQDAKLSEKTRALIDGTIKDIRQQLVVSYSEELVKVQPGRKSCKTELCGDYPCISLAGPSNEELEYRCAISD